MTIAAMKTWKKPKPCWCSGYWFPHRKASGTCEHNPDVIQVAHLLADRLGMTEDERLDLIVDVAWSNPGIPSTECTF